MSTQDRTTSRVEVADAIDRHLAQLAAMLQAIHAGGAESFNELSVEQQDDFLSACYDKVAGIRQQWQRYQALAPGRLLVASSADTKSGSA